MGMTRRRRRRRRGWRSSDDYKEPEGGNVKIEEVDSCRSSDADDNEEEEDYSNVDEDGGNDNDCKADCKAGDNIVSGDDSFYIPPIVLFDCLFLFSIRAIVT